MTYQQLTQEQRYQLYARMKANWAQQDITAEIGVHPSTISREVKRNCGCRGIVQSKPRRKLWRVKGTAQ